MAAIHTVDARSKAVLPGSSYEESKEQSMGLCAPFAYICFNRQLCNSLQQPQTVLCSLRLCSECVCVTHSVSGLSVCRSTPHLPWLSSRGLRLQALSWGFHVSELLIGFRPQGPLVGNRRRSTLRSFLFLYLGGTPPRDVSPPGGPTSDPSPKVLWLHICLRLCSPKGGSNFLSTPTSRSPLPPLDPSSSAICAAVNSGACSACCNLPGVGAHCWRIYQELQPQFAVTVKDPDSHRNWKCPTMRRPRADSRGCQPWGFPRRSSG